jgi:hypothetical protein
MKSPTIRFETKIEKQDFGTFAFTVVKLDQRLHDVLPLKEFPRLRVEVDLNGVIFKGSWQPSGGEWYLVVSKPKLKKAGLQLGSTVKIAFRVVPQDEVDVPEELARELEVDATAAEAWEALTPGKRRGLCYLINEPKTPKTRGVRLAKVLAMLHGEDPLPWDRMKEKEPAKKPGKKTEK